MVWCLAVLRASDWHQVLYRSERHLIQYTVSAKNLLIVEHVHDMKIEHLDYRNMLRNIQVDRFIRIPSASTNHN
jgi:hypothetical protein